MATTHNRRDSPAAAYAGLASAAGFWAAVCAIIGGGVMVSSSSQSPDRPYPFIIAHRGASQIAPENTLASISRAFSLGADMVEVDVRRTRDDQVVLMHDPTVDRTTNGKGKVADLTLAQIRRFDAGSWKGKPYSGQRVPTIEEALSAVKRRGKLLIEIKDRGMEQRIASAATSADVKRIQFQSFMFEAAAGVKELLPGVDCGWLLGGHPEGQTWDDVVDRSLAARLSFLACQHSLLDETIVTTMHHRGLKVYAYTVNDKKTIRSMHRIGVDGIITDAPDMARSALLEMPRRDVIPPPPAE